MLIYMIVCTGVPTFEKCYNEPKINYKKETKLWYWAVFAILSIFYIDKTGSTETQLLGLNRKVVADRAGTNVRKWALCFSLVVNLIDYSDIDNMMDINNEKC
jgi:hypothetical protein